jgi:transposase
MKKCIEGLTVYGIDIGKNTFHVVGLDSIGKPMLHSKFKRDRLLAHFANTPAALIGMESCPGSQWLARKLQASGHTVKIIPAQFVKPYVKSNKNDMVDAAAIAEAVTRPTMRFTQIRQPEQSARHALHRVRDRYMSQRTGLINQMRGFLLELGIAIRQGTGVFRLDIPRGLGMKRTNFRRPCAHCLETCGTTLSSWRTGSRNSRSRFSAACSTATLPDDS